MNINNKYNIENLPVADKRETLQKFLEWVKPLIDDEEYKKTVLMTEEYLNSKQSDHIHEFLLKKASDVNNSWLVEWWIKYMYLSSRGPVTPECNAPMIYNNENLKKYNPIEIISIISYAIATVYLEVKKNGNLINDQQFTPKKTFSLDQLIYLFASFREPNKTFDTYYTNDEVSTFIVIYKNNIAYKLEVIRDNEVVDLNEIYVNVKNIIENNNKQKIGFNFITSHTNRDEAKTLLDNLINNDKNKKSYKDLKDSIVTIAYDDFEAKDEKSIFKNFLNAEDFNRLHGKCLLVQVSKDKNVVLCADHTMADGGTEIYLMNRISQFFDQKPSLKEVRLMPHVEEIKFDINQEQLTQLEKVHNNFINYINNVDIIFVESKIFNKNTLKELNLVSADAIIQLMYQIAQYKTNKKFFNTYVAVDVRNFFKGRTECVRPISEYSKEFAIDFVENKIKDKTIAYKKLEAIQNEHYKRSKECQAGKGINRYMLGIKLAWSENQDLFGPKPKLFDSLAWTTISENLLSTSSIVSPYIEWVYFDPVHVNGIGIFYAMKAENTRYSISYWIKDKNYAQDFAKNLEWAMEKFIELLKE